MKGMKRQYQEIKKVKDKYESSLLAVDGVVGCSVGYKQLQGKKTNKLAIVCLVQKKKPRKQLSEKELLPKEIEGVPVDVIEVGKIERFEI